jgi:23S rRNA (guanosine2251-2'-O)-methyltransferase
MRINRMKEWIIGRNPVYEALLAQRRDVFRLWIAEGAQEKGRLAEIASMAKSRKLAVERVPRARIDAMGENPQGVALECSGYSYLAVDDILEVAAQRGEPLFVLILDTLQNPQNLGTLLRSAEAAGIHGVILPLKHSADVTPAVVSASAGATEHMVIAQANLALAMQTLKEAGAWLVGLEGSPDARPADQVDLTGPLALVVGSEGEGMRPLVRQSCDFLLSLPMKGKIESLNAAVAGSIAIYLALMQRERAQTSPKD